MKVTRTANGLTVDYQGEELGSLLEAMERIVAQEDAADFMRLYRATFEDPTIADSNVGYMTGYYGRTRMLELQDRFGVRHPIFGRNPPDSPDKLFEIGMRIGQGELTRGTCGICGRPAMTSSSILCEAHADDPPW